MFVRIDLLGDIFSKILARVPDVGLADPRVSRAIQLAQPHLTRGLRGPRVGADSSGLSQRRRHPDGEQHMVA